MFDIGFGEILVTAFVAFLVLGPKELPVFLYKLGKLLKSFKDLKQKAYPLYQDFIKEAELETLKAEAFENMQRQETQLSQEKSFDHETLK
jgi:sec-independent protein translocase protein TatB